MKTNLDHNLDTLTAINAAHIDGVPLYDVLRNGDVSLWSCMQQLLWLELQARASKPSTIKQTTLLTKFKLLILDCMLVSISFLSFLYFMIRRPRILLYSTDVYSKATQCDSRLSEVYRFMRSKNISYGEIIHAPRGKKFIMNFFRRRRPVMYLESFGIVHHWLQALRLTPRLQAPNVSSLTYTTERNYDRATADRLVTTYAQHAHTTDATIRALSWIFEKIKPQYIFSIDDYRYCDLILTAAQRAHVQSLLFQHGRFNTYIAGITQPGIPNNRRVLPDFYLVWNAYWKKRLHTLTSAYQPEQLIIAGSPHAHTTNNFIKHKASTSEDISVVVIFEPKAALPEIGDYLRDMMQDTHIHLFVKFRSDSPLEEQVAIFSNGVGKDIVFNAIQSFKDNNQIDTAVGTYSTLLYELIEMEIPIGVLATSLTQATDLVTDDCATLINRTTDNTNKTIYKIAKTSPEVLRGRADMIKTTADISTHLSHLIE